MNVKTSLLALSLAAVSVGAMAQASQQPQTDYQRAMNSVNNSSAAAFGQPRADDDAAGTSAANTVPNPNTPTAPIATNTEGVAGAANLPTDGIANTYSANGAPGGFGAATNNRVGYGNVNNGVGAASTTSGSIGLGAFNASPYNSAPNSNGRGGSFTGQ